MAAHLKNLLPEDITIGIAHGRMNGEQLEQIMFDFFEKKYDVLLCTTLIENGVDQPNANTMIVYDADRMGLSQLYQMRGRVGRSDRIARAYFFIAGAGCFRKSQKKARIHPGIYGTRIRIQDCHAGS